MARNVSKSAQLVRSSRAQDPYRALLSEYKRQGTKISDSFWLKVRQIISKESQGSQPDDLLLELFNAAAKQSQAVFIGNLLLERKVRLPIEQEAVFIKALVREGKSDQALHLWNTRQVPPDQVNQWKNVGIQLNCSIGRLRTAESIALDTSNINGKSLYALTEAYAVSGGPRLDHWTRVLSEHGSSQEINQAIRMLLRRRQKAVLGPLIAKIGDKLSKSTVLSVLAATKDRSAVSLALATHPEILSDRKFIKSWMRSADASVLPRLAELLPASSAAQAELIDVLLKQDNLEAAVKVLDDALPNTPGITMAAVQRFVRYAVFTKNDELLDRMMALLRGQDTKENANYSKSIQLIVRYLSFKKDFDKLFQLLSSIDAHRLHHSNFVSIWKALFRCAKADARALHATRFDVQQFFLEMLANSKFRMDPLVFELAAKTFLRIKDVSSAAFVVRYMAEIGNLPIEQGFTKSVLKISEEESPSTWRGFVEKLCCQRGVNFDNICADTKAISPKTFN